MSKVNRYLLWAVVFICCSCSDFSGLCKHGFGGVKVGFSYTNDQITDNSPSFYHYAVNTTQNDQAEAAAFPYAYKEITWGQLTDVSFTMKFNKKYQVDFPYPDFGNTVKILDKQELAIKGFMIPLDVEQNLYAISENPYAACFFCGKAGPASVVSLKFKGKPRRFKTDEYILVKGTMVLNGTNVDDFIYIFKNAEEVK